MATSDDILGFWFPRGLDADEETHRRQHEWWFRGGADQAITQRFTHVLEAAAAGELDHWAEDPRSRLALIIVLDRARPWATLAVPKGQLARHTTSNFGRPKYGLRRQSDPGSEAGG